MMETDNAGPVARLAGPTRPDKRSARSWHTRLSAWDVKYMPYVLISPFFILFAIFGLFPLIYNGVVSLRTWRLDDPASDGWAGLANYRRLFSDTDFWNALYNTFGIFVVATIPQLILALVLAGVLNRRLRAVTTFRMGVLVPYITPIAASTLVFGAVFAANHGIANYLLHFIGVGAIDWRADRWSSWTAISLMVDWRWIGYMTLIYLAAMQSVSRDVYEAAAIDGAGPQRQFWQITVPLIRPTIVFTAVIATIGMMQLFTEPLLFDSNPSSAGGGSAGQFQTVAMLIYKTGWKDLNLGYAGAMSWFMFVIIVVLAGINAILTNRIGGRK
jgi:cellobiose transport system permease protein